MYVVGLSQNYIIRSCKRCSYGYEEVDFLTHGSIWYMRILERAHTGYDMTIPMLITLIGSLISWMCTCVLVHVHVCIFAVCMYTCTCMDTYIHTCTWRYVVSLLSSDWDWDSGDGGKHCQLESSPCWEDCPSNGGQHKARKQVLHAWTWMQFMAVSCGGYVYTHDCT